MASRTKPHADRSATSSMRGRSSCPYRSDPQCPPLPDGTHRRKCPFNDIDFLNRFGLWCKCPLNADEDELIWRCDMSAGVTRVDLVDEHYYSGKVTKEICKEFCRIHDEYRRRMVDYSVERDE